MERKKIKRFAVRRRCTAAAFCAATALAASAEAIPVFNNYSSTAANTGLSVPDTLDPITLAGAGTASLNSFTFRTNINETNSSPSYYSLPAVAPVAVITFWDNVYYSTSASSGNVLSGATNLGSITTTLSPASGTNVVTNSIGVNFDTTVTPSSPILLPAGVTNLSSPSMVYVQISYYANGGSTAPSNFAEFNGTGSGTGESVSAVASSQGFGAVTAGSEPYWTYVDGLLTGTSSGTFATGSTFGASGSKPPSGGYTLFGTFANQTSIDATVGTQFTYTGTDPTTPATWDYSSLNFTSNGSPAAYANLSNGTSVIFDDTAAGSTTVSVAAGGVAPSLTVFNNSSSSYTLSGPGGINGIGALDVNGAGTVTLNTINTYTGVTSVANGTLSIGAAGSIASTNIQVNSGGTLNLPGGNASLSAAGTSLLFTVNGILNMGGNACALGTLYGAGAINLNGSSPTLVLNGGNYSGSLSSTNGLALYLNASGGTLSSVIKDGGNPTSVVVNSNWTLSGDNTYSGGTILKSGTVTVGVSGLGTGPVNLSGGTITTTAFTVTDVPGIVSGGALSVKGTGTLELSGNNTFVGAITASTGFVQFDSAASLGGATSIAQSGSADFVVNDTSGSAGIVNGKAITITLAGAGDSSGVDGGALHGGSTNATWAGNVSIGSTATTISTGIGSFNLSGAITSTGSGAITFGNTTADYYYSTLVLDPPTSTSNTYTGLSQVASRSTQPFAFLTVQLGNNNGFSPAAGLAFITGQGFGEVDLNGFNQNVTYLMSTTNTAPSNYQISNSQTTLSTLTITNGSSGSTAETYLQPITGDIALVKTGPGNQILTGTSSYTGGTTIAGGTITVGNSAALGTGPVNLTGGKLALANLSGGGIESIGNAINVVSGTTSSIQLGVISGTTNTGASVGPISISAGASVAVTIPAAVASTRGVLVTPSVSIASSTGGAYTGKLDLGYNDLVVTGSTLSQVAALVGSSYNNGAWNGNGIASSAAASDTTHLTALGVIVNDSDGTPLYGTGGSIASTFDGSSPVDGNILVKYTYYGDTDLNGKVDGSDYSRIDAGAISSGALTGWQNGDFNYDGVINGSDYTLIDNAYNTQSAVNPLAVAGAQLATPTAQIAGTSAVPEPTTLSVLAVGAIGLMGRRRRKN